MSLMREGRLPADDSKTISLMIPVRSCFLAIGVLRAAGHLRAPISLETWIDGILPKSELVGTRLSEGGLARAVPFYRSPARNGTRSDPVDDLDILSNPIVHPADADSGRQFWIDL